MVSLRKADRMDYASMIWMVVLSITKLVCLQTQLMSLPMVTGGEKLAAENATRHLKSTQPHREPCRDVEHVCTSILKTEGVVSTEQGHYCSCPGCEDPPWDEDDKKSLTWYHFERSDQLVQYRFCEPLMPKHECNDLQEVASVIRTDAKGWNPRIKELNCACPKNRYFLQGWTLTTGKYGQQWWDYRYICDRPPCDEGSPCVKHYIDKNSTEKKTLGYKFLCSCGEGYTCPIRTDKSKRENVNKSDNAGHYVNGYCRKHQSVPKTNSNHHNEAL